MSTEREIEDIARLRRPPHSVESEQSVLGGLLVDNRGWDRIGALTTDSFYERRHRLIFDAIGGLLKSSMAADVVTVFSALHDDRDDCGGMAYLNALSQSVPSASNIGRYAEIVMDRALERSIIATADQAATIAFGDGRTCDKLDRISTLFRLLEGRTMRGEPRALGEIIGKRVAHIGALHEGDGELAAWATPLAALNRLLTGGMRPGRVYVLAARPSIGKSALAQALALRFASDGRPVLFLSQEMPDTELADRILSALGRVDFGSIQTGHLQPDDWGRLSDGAERAARLPFYIDDQAALTLGQIRTKARAVRGLQVLVIDYLQLSAGAGSDKFSNRNSEIEEVSRGLKSLAKELGIAVVLLSQLNRDVEKRVGKRPMLADLRDSGAIEQDADVVMLMWPLSHSAVDGVSMLGIDVAKNRGGARGDFALCFWGHHMRFGEADMPVSHYTAKPQGGEI